MTRQRTSHFFRRFDAQQVKAAMQNASGEIAQNQSRTAGGFLRF
jgi:hypothetical protein